MAQTKTGFITLTDISDGIQGIEGPEGPEGPEGSDGQFERTVYQNGSEQPDFPVGPVDADGSIAPTGWTFEPTESETQRFKSVATFPDENTVFTPEVSEITFSGTTAGVTFIPAEAEVTKLGITEGIPGGKSGIAPDPATQETTVIEIGGTTGDPFEDFANVTPSGLSSGFRAVEFADGYYVAIGEGGNLYTATDPTATTVAAGGWEENTTTPSTTLNALAYDGTNWIVVGDNIGGVATLITATDPTGTWTTLSGHGVTSNPHGILFVRGVWVVSGVGVRTATPATVAAGSAWSLEDGSSVSFLRGIDFDDDTGVFVVAGNSGTLLAATVPSGAIIPGNMTFSAPGYSGTVNVITMQEVKFGNGRFVAVGSQGQTITSTTGTGDDWDVNNAGVSTDLFGLAFSDGTFYATGSSGKIRTSTDGASWSELSSDVGSVVTNSSLRGAFFGNNQFVTVGTGSGIIIVPEGEASTFTIDGDSRHFAAPVTFDLAPNRGLTDMRNDLVTLINNSPEIEDLTATATGAGQDRITLISDFGGAFSNILVDISGGGDASAVVRFLDHMDGTDTDGALSAQTRLLFSGVSEDTTFSFGAATGLGSQFFSKIATDGAGTWAGVGSSGETYYATTSDPGGAWAKVDPKINTNNPFMTDIAYGNGLWVAVGNKRDFDGVDDVVTIWTAIDPTLPHDDASGDGWAYSGNTGLTNISMSGVTYDGTQWIVVGKTGTILTAIDPTKTSLQTGGWILRTTPTLREIRDIELGEDGSGNDLWVAVGETENVGALSGKSILLTATAIDGTWTARDSGWASGTRSVAYANGVWVVTGDNLASFDNRSAVLTATDPTSTWTIHPATASSNGSTVWEATYHDGTWFAVLGNGTYIYSIDDGDNWIITQSSGVTSQLRSAVSGGGFLVFGGASGVILAGSSGGSVFTIDGDRSSEFTNSVPITFSGLSDAASMASQAAAELNDPANGVTGLNIFAVGNQLQLDSRTTGTRDQITVSVTGGTAGVAINRDAGFAGNGVVASTFEITPARRHFEKITTLTFTGTPTTGTYPIDVDGADVIITIGATPQSLSEFATDVATQISLLSGYSADADEAVVTITGTIDVGEYTTTTPSNPTLGITAVQVDSTLSSITGVFPGLRTPAQALVIIKAVFDNNLIGGYDVGTISGTTFSVTSQETGIEAELIFVITDGTSGNLVESTVVTNDGSESDSDGERDRWSTTINRVTYTGFFDDTVNDTTILDGGGQAAKQASDLNLEVAGPDPIFVATSATTDGGVTGVLTITAGDNGNQYDTTASVKQGASTLGFDSSANETPPVVITDGVANPDWSQPVQDGFRGGLGLRGAGRHDRSFTVTDLVAPDVLSDKFNSAARCAVAGGYPFNATGDVVTCNSNETNTGSPVSFVNVIPVEGDVVILTVTDSRTSTTAGDNITTVGAIHNGLGIANEDWEGFAVQIDGNLLVDGTIVANKLRAFSISAGQIKAGAITLAAVTNSTGEKTLNPGDIGAGVSNLRVNSENEPLNSADQTLEEWIAAGNTAETFEQAVTDVGSRLVIEGTKISIYEAGVLRVVLGDLTP